MFHTSSIPIFKTQWTENSTFDIYRLIYYKYKLNSNIFTLKSAKINNLFGILNMNVYFYAQIQKQNGIIANREFNIRDTRAKSDVGF